MKIGDLIEIKLPKNVLREMKQSGSKNIKSYNYGDCAVIVSKDNGRWHFSLSHANRLPTLEENMSIKNLLFPNVTMEMKFVTQKPNCFIIHFFESTEDKSNNLENAIFHYEKDRGVSI
ncbi:DUF7694 domain-containing protein [Schinkia azotoformans]|uniref:DUF7694 domain-containing protein n=1 Tax=Schinkia azotoformans TaxID=1454 RepID=UPI002DB7F3B8|nr:hypothetical protein [Schinkia azotoformans]MEC1759870.1 hypothetical protein [Schinkia azotoformans]